MKYRSNKHDLDAGALIFIGLIILYFVSVICATIGVTQAESNRHAERMEQIKICGDEAE